jgi:CheY-like chemotaxis protein
VARDITERIRMEEALKEADRRKDEFLAMLAHELRNPLSAIHNALQLARKSRKPEHLAWAQDVIGQQVKHLARLIDDLLDVSRITRGKIQLRRERQDLAPIIHRAVETVRPLIEARQHQLTVSLTSGPLRLEADPTRLEQILVNLLTNAAKYTEEGGRIRLTGRRDGGELVLAVRDDGVGIAPEMLPHVFEPFTQVARSLDRSQGGLGIGLTLVQKLAEMHGGSVSAASDGPGRGSEFTVRLPAPREVPAPPEPQATAAGGAGRGLRILVVDDNRISARGLADLLGLSGHEVRTAFDGRAALDAARRHRPEVVLLDIGLPEMDGYQVAAQLRREEGLKDALIVAITGYGQEQDLRRSREAGFDRHLVKPVDLEALEELLRSRQQSPP